MAGLLLPLIYLAFSIYGLSDPLLGSAWPVLYQDFGVDIGSAGGISMLIAFGTVIPALFNERLLLKFGTGVVTTVSVILSAIAIFGFSISRSYTMFILFALPYGLGVGGVDSSINNYMALHYKSQHLNWIHGMWAVGTVIGPHIMGFALSAGKNWSAGYRYVLYVYIVTAVILLCTLKLWKSSQPQTAENTKSSAKPHSYRELLSIPGTKEALLMFLCYTGVEQTAILWSGTYLVQCVGLNEAEAASLASLFFIGMMTGRLGSGFIAMKVSEKQMVHAGELVIFIGLLLLILPLPKLFKMAGLVIEGLGCAPVFPSMVHAIPLYYGRETGQAVMGIEIACAYAGTMAAPPIFGILAQNISADLFPWYMLFFLVLHTAMNRIFERKIASYQKAE